jgi:hypothetical protein
MITWSCKEENMSRPRYLPDPVLEHVSQVLPDSAINEFFPANYAGKKGKPFTLTTSNYYRIHLLSLLKGITSFNQLCSELLYHQTYRRFANVKSVSKIPKPNTLSDFRSEIGSESFALINDLLLERLFSIVPLPAVAVAVPDSTDLEASCSGRGKKNVPVQKNVNANESTRPKVLPKAAARKNRGSPHSSWGIKSTPFD